MRYIYFLFLGLAIFQFSSCAKNIGMIEKNNNMKMFQSVNMKDARIVQTGKDKLYCSSCGMTLPMFYKTNYIAKVDGKLKQFCSLHCLLKVKESGKEVKDIKVVDAKTLKLIDASKAYYVVGSNIKGTMSMISKYAFENIDDAKKFVTKNGGKIMNFEDAINVAKKDFSPAMMQKMKAKKAIMIKKGERVYKTKCKSNKNIIFNSVAEAKSYLINNQICDQLTPKELQMVGLYLKNSKE